MQTQNLTPYEQLFHKLITEFPVLILYLISARWIILQLKDAWKLYISQIASKETRLIETEKQTTVKLILLESEVKRLSARLLTIEEEFRRIKDKLSDIQNYLNLKSRKNDDSPL